MSARLFLSWRSFAKNWWPATHLVQFASRGVGREDFSLTSHDSFFDNLISSPARPAQVGAGSTDGPAPDKRACRKRKAFFKFIAAAVQ